MFDSLAIIRDDVAQTNSEILHNRLKCRNTNSVDDLLNSCFQLSNGFEVIAVPLSINIAPQKAVTCVQIQRIWRPIEAPVYPSAKMRSPKCSSRTLNTLLLQCGRALLCMNQTLSKSGALWIMRMKSFSKTFTYRSVFTVPSTNLAPIIL